jgi:hypothetical protein
MRFNLDRFQCTNKKYIYFYHLSQGDYLDELLIKNHGYMSGYIHVLYISNDLVYFYGCFELLYTGMHDLLSHINRLLIR